MKFQIFDNKDIFLKNDFNEKNIKSINLEKYSVLSFALMELWQMKLQVLMNLV